MEAGEGRRSGEKSWLNPTAGISFDCYMLDCEKSREYGVTDHRSRLLSAVCYSSFMSKTSN